MRKILVLVLFSGSLFGSEDWYTKVKDFCNRKENGVGLAWLKVSPGARGAVIGDGYLSVVRGPTSMWWNPAGLARSDGLQASFTHTQHFLGIRNEFVGLSNKRTNNAYGVAMSGAFINGIELRDERQDSLGEFSAYDFSIIGSYARSFSEGGRTSNFAIGGSVKGVYEQIYIYKLSSWLLDFGMTYTPHTGVWLAATINNLGPKLKFESKEFKTPFAWKVGISYEGTQFLTSIGVNKYKDTILRGGIGLEYKIGPYLFLRAGYKIRYDTETMSLGFGVRWKGFSIDYAFKPYGLGLGATHIFTITK